MRKGFEGAPQLCLDTAINQRTTHLLNLSLPSASELMMGYILVASLQQKGRLTTLHKVIIFCDHWGTSFLVTIAKSSCLFFAR